MECCNDQSKECPCQKGGCEGGMCCGACTHEESACSDPSQDYSNSLDIGKFVVLSVVSGGIYLVYWFYRNWKHIKEHTKSSIRPAARTVGSIFPILDIVLYCHMFTAINSLAKKEGARTFPLIWICICFSLTIVIAWILFAASFLFYDPGTQFAIELFGLIATIVGTLILLPVQLSLNDIWNRTQKTKILRTWYTNGEKAWIVVGALIMFFSLLSVFMTPLPPPSIDYPEIGVPSDSYENNLDLQTPSEPEKQPEQPQEQPQS